MSGMEGILCGVVKEVLKTCFVYGKRWLNNYRKFDEYTAQDIIAMEGAINKLLDIKDFYVEFWVYVPARDRRLLGKYLERIHALLCGAPTNQTPPTDLINNETFTALSPADVYQRLGEFTAAIEAPGVNSPEDTMYVHGVWERAKREIDQVSAKVKYAVVGRDRATKFISIV